MLIELKYRNELLLIDDFDYGRNGFNLIDIAFKQSTINRSIKTCQI